MFSSKIKRGLRLVIGLLLIGALLFFARYSILGAVGDWLIKEDPIGDNPVTLFVLGGNSHARGKAGYELYGNGVVERLVCTGKNIPTVLEALGIKKTEAQISRTRMVKLGVPNSKITIINEGTSTKEESEIILEYCKKNGLTEAAIVSSKFHTRRVWNTFKPDFEAEKIKLYVWGCGNDFYDENEWWVSERAMIMVNNEYIKHLYYALKY